MLLSLFFKPFFISILRQIDQLFFKEPRPPPKSTDPAADYQVAKLDEFLFFTNHMGIKEAPHEKTQLIGTLPKYKLDSLAKKRVLCGRFVANFDPKL